MKTYSRGCGSVDLGSNGLCLNDGNEATAEASEEQFKSMTEGNKLDVKERVYCGCGYDKCNTNTPEDVAIKAGNGETNM